MPPKKQNIKREKNNLTNQSIVKYTSICVKDLLESLPKKQFIYNKPIFIEMKPECQVLDISSMEFLNNPTQPISSINSTNSTNSKKTQKELNNQLSQTIESKTHKRVFPLSYPNSEPLIVNDFLYSHLPIHPHIKIQCSVCKNLINDIQYVLRHPHLRGRITPLCSTCSHYDEYVDMKE